MGYYRSECAGWEHNYSSWTSVDFCQPPDGVIVMTKIEDRHGTRNICKLYRKGNLWWLADGSMYVYYTPTHWRSAASSTHWTYL